MPLDDLDLTPPIKNNSTHQRFYKSGIILFSIGVISSLFLFISFSEGYESAFKVPLVYLPILFGLIPFFFSVIYSYFKKSIKEPLIESWGKIHFYLTIIPLYLFQLVGIIYFHHLYMSGVNPFASTVSPISIFWLIILIVIIGQIFFLANIFRSINLTFYKNADYHPTHILFLFAAFFFILKSAFAYIFGIRNTALDFQFHDTYYVISLIHIHCFIVFIFLLFAGLYYFLNMKLKKPLNSILSKIHFFLMLLSVLYFIFFLGYEISSSSTRRYFSSEEAILLYRDAIVTQYKAIALGFLLAQVSFLINLFRSVFIFIFIFGKNK